MKHVTALAVALCWPLAALAQGPPSQPLSRVEIWGGWARALPIAGGFLQSDYAPVMQLGGTPLASRTTQTLTVDTGPGNGFDFGVNVFLGRVFGVQAAFTRSSTTITGPASEYKDYLRYISRPPPNYDPVENTYERPYPSQAAAGSLTYRSVAVGGVVRWAAAQGRLGGTVAGGVNVDHYSGEVENLVYTQFVLGGHSTLFPVHHRVVMTTTDDKRFWGPYLAADFHVRVASRLALLAGIRATLGSRITIPTSPVRLVDPNEDTWTPDLIDVQQVLGIQPLELPGTRWHVFIGAKVFVR